jgi:hypothetical protein
MTRKKERESSKKSTARARGGVGREKRGEHWVPVNSKDLAISVTATPQADRAESKQLIPVAIHLDPLFRSVTVSRKGSIHSPTLQTANPNRTQ